MVILLYINHLSILFKFFRLYQTLLNNLQYLNEIYYRLNSNDSDLQFKGLELMNNQLYYFYLNKIKSNLNILKHYPYRKLVKNFYLSKNLYLKE